MVVVSAIEQLRLAKEKAARLTGDPTPELISATNNYVFRARGSGGPVVVKMIADADIDPAYLATTTTELGRELPVPAIHCIVSPDGPGDFAAILMDYVEGVPLSAAGVLRDPAVAAAFAELLAKCLIVVSDLPPYFEGPGLFKKDAKPSRSLAEFVEAYFYKYLNRIKMRWNSTAFLGRVTRWAAGFHERLHARAYDDRIDVVSIDMNLRNFLFDGRQIYVLNLPILGNSLRDHSVGAILAQTAGTAAESAVSDRLRSTGVVGRYAAYFDVWMSLGILSFYASQRTGPLPHATNWGSTITLIDHIEDVIDRHPQAAA